MRNKCATFCIGLLTLCAATIASAQEETWKAPFGGAFTATFTGTTDYSYRGISQTQRTMAFQAGVTYETPTVGEAALFSAYAGAWGSNVSFAGTDTFAEIDIIAGFRLKALDQKFTADLGYIRYNYLGADSALMYNFNEFGLVIGYDFGIVQLSGAIRYSPNFYADSGVAWYKWAQAVVPLPFINFNENIAFKVFGAIGSQYVERNVNYGIPNQDYWDWQLGLTVTVYGFDLTLAYTDTNIDVAGCLGTQNCEARAIFSISKTF